MGIQIAHFPVVRTLEDFDFKFQPGVDEKLVRELSTGRFVAQAENVLLFGPPGVGKTHLAIAIGRAVVESGHSVLFTTAAALLGALAKAEAEGKLAEQLAFYVKPKLLIIDELGYLPFEKRSAHLFFQLVVRRYERASTLITTNQMVTQWGQVFGDEMIAAAIPDPPDVSRRWVACMDVRDRGVLDWAVAVVLGLGRTKNRLTVNGADTDPPFPRTGEVARTVVWVSPCAALSV